MIGRIPSPRGPARTVVALTALALALLWGLALLAGGAAQTANVTVSVTKQVTGNAPAGKSYGFTLQCTESDQAFLGQRSVKAGETASFSAVPSGASCSLSEDDLGDDAPLSTTGEFSGRTITASTTVTVTNHYPVIVSLRKEVTGPAPANAIYKLRLTCNGQSLSVNLKAGQTEQAFSLKAGQTCTALSEPTSHNPVTTIGLFSGASQVINADTTFTVTNRFDADIYVRKEVTGNAPAGVSYGFRLTCTTYSVINGGYSARTQSWTASVAAGRRVKIASVNRTAPCRLEETNAHGATSADGLFNRRVIAGNSVFTVTNHFPAATATPAPTATATPTPAPTATPAPDPTPQPVVATPVPCGDCPTPVPPATATPVPCGDCPTPAPTPAPTATATATATVAPPTATATVAPPTATATVAPPTATATVAPPTVTATVAPPTVTATVTPPTATVAPPTATAAPPTPPTVTPSATPSVVHPRAPQPRAVVTPTASATPTPVPTVSATPIPTATATPTRVVEPTPTPAPAPPVAPPPTVTPLPTTTPITVALPRRPVPTATPTPPPPPRPTVAPASAPASAPPVTATPTPEPAPLVAITLLSREIPVDGGDGADGAEDEPYRLSLDCEEPDGGGGTVTLLELSAGERRVITVPAGSFCLLADLRDDGDGELELPPLLIDRVITLEDHFADASDEPADAGDSPAPPSSGTGGVAGLADGPRALVWPGAAILALAVLAAILRRRAA